MTCHTHTVVEEYQYQMLVFERRNMVVFWLFIHAIHHRFTNNQNMAQLFQKNVANLSWYLTGERLGVRNTSLDGN
jgi:hypothetical protein